MPEEMIKLKPEPDSQPRQELDVFSDRLLEDTGNLLDNNILFPVNVAMSGRSIKLRDVFNLSGAISVSSTVVTVSNTITETTLASFNFFPNEWHVGMCVRLTALGIYSTANATDTVTLTVKHGSTATNTIVNTAATVTSQPWNLTWYGIIGTLGSSGTIESQMIGGINNVRKDDPNTATATIDTTVAELLALTATWSNALSGNTISIRQFIVEILN